MYIIVGILANKGSLKGGYDVIGVRLYDFTSGCCLDLSLRDASKIDEEIIGLPSNLINTFKVKSKFKYFYSDGSIRFSNKKYYIGYLSVIWNGLCSKSVYCADLVYKDGFNINLVYDFRNNNIRLVMHGYDINTGEKVDLSGVDCTVLTKEDSNKLLEILKQKEYLIVTKNNCVRFNGYFCYYKHSCSTTVVDRLNVYWGCKVFEFLFDCTEPSLYVDSILLPSGLKAIIVERGLLRFLKSKVYFSKDTDSLVIIAFLERLLDGFDFKFNVKTLSWDINLPKILSRTVDKQKLSDIADVFVECLSVIRSNHSNSKSMNLSLLEETFSILNSIGFNFYFY